MGNKIDKKRLRDFDGMEFKHLPEGRTIITGPLLSDLWDSGSIEQDADIVLLLYRDLYYDADTKEPDIIECIIAKNRNGEVGTVKLKWLPKFQKAV